MISFFRNIFQSKIGLALTFALIALIALAFAASDITGTTFGGVAGNDRVARVGDERISTSTLSQTASSAMEQVRQEQPTATMQEFVANGGLDEVLRQLIDRAALGGYAEEYGLRAGDNLINSEILQIGAFRGVNGEFDQTVYEAALRNQGLTDAMLRNDLGDGLLAQQLLAPGLAAQRAPDALTRRYGSFVRERRQGTIALIPSVSFAPENDPTDNQVQTFYEEERERYVLPERRTMRFAAFGDDAITDRVEPTEAEIAARYERDAAQYEAQETRTISSFFVPTEDAANAIRERVNAGLSLENAASEAGFSVTRSQPSSREEIAALTSAAVAEAVFAANRGQVAQPARSALGWYIARIDAIDRTAARSLAQARGEIATQLASEKRAAALADLSTRIEDRVSDRASLTEIAEEFGLELNTTPAMLSDGRLFENPRQRIAEQLQDAVATVFQMDESEPQLAEVVRGQQFIVFEANEITPSAAAPLADIREQVVRDWRLAQGDAEARDAADRVIARLAEADGSINQALSAEEGQIPPPQRINMTRAELRPQNGQRIPTPLVLLFSMAEGTAKRLEAPNNLGWYVVELNSITAAPIEDEDPLFEQARASLSETFADELAEQLTASVREELGVDRNETAIEAVRKQLTGEI